ncbi:hypothetical protein [Paenibacillus sp. AR247]|uniref:hypothetical protein n=1 Tax=Paenibacillus sp. AR247 TaxID=1631599 RepID=UPI0026B94C50|nr:hypothetical protein [Paenibacillus sp. AR247]
MSRKVVALEMSREELRRAEIDEKERTAEKGTAAGLTSRGLADEEPSRDQISRSEGDGGDIRLERIVFIGRTYDEYLRMFNLKPGDLKGRTVLERYVAAVLPVLPFADRQFDMTLSAHFLFMYSDKLDYAFHEQTVGELMRVTKEEIRIFPLVDQSSRRYKDMQKLLTFAAGNGWSAEERPSDYEFQRGASSMLVLTRN